ncbi:malto-oligosyltrehalose trehalohydrolase [Afipia sp. Root123D2]|uniref:malto-oligosyltrehalose trehalohydrolase n=1 Tax=Afipia sp. Root123D2 TaxID=1736436 RepID=UPI0006F6A356|nr:malto-oligosyltrehalose trehalohydrolase [Afipia sp. Root123D2]KQW20934.1 malto-oligosyltrehalose trehalohydrolase [Afipia sp. Root123D2]
MSDDRFGATPEKNGVTFRLWAPGAARVDVMLDMPHAMRATGDGWFSIHVPGAGAGSRYRFRIDGDLQVPDPASQFQPEDISGPSEVLDHHAYRWRANDWRGRPWEEAIFLEAHVGTFTATGTYRAMIDRLDHLAATGITALELMPLADFPGRRNWGYDGVLWYAPDSSYGRPDELKALIDEAHLRGMMVFLDVVYNHFGPEGNYLGRYAPAFFSPSHTPWGNAIDYRVPQVRQFAIDNALYWLRDYRFDGLRLDAVQAIVEVGEPPLLNELSRQAGLLAEATGRTIHLVVENDDNRAGLLDPETDPPHGRYRAQWNDDYHHAWHVLLTGETGDYYRDYPEPQRDIARALGSGFAYQGEASAHRGGKLRGEASGNLPPTAFVSFLQNHDQIGNRALGDRLEAIAKPAAIEAALAITLLAPMPPMLFMGEEWGSQTPFPFFCDFKGDLANAVRQGRRREFQSAYEKYGNEIPDPLNDSTFQLAHLDWNEAESAPGRKRLKLVRDLLTIRRERIVPCLAAIRFGEAHATGDGGLAARWIISDGRSLKLAANLSARALPAPASAPSDQPVWGQTPNGTMPPWSVVWTLGGP